MIFKQVQQVLDGTKTQTRRPVKEGELGQVDLPGSRDYMGVWIEPPNAREREWPLSPPEYLYGRTDLIQEQYKLKWFVGRTYAVQPGRGKKAVGRIRITKIRREVLGDISLDDIFAEGIFRVPEHKGWYTYKGGVDHISPLTAYFTLWDSIYGKGAWERVLYDDVWVLDFERSEG